jgi:hypothetical protein
MQGVIKSGVNGASNYILLSLLIFIIQTFNYFSEIIQITVWV